MAQRVAVVDFVHNKDEHGLEWELAASRGVGLRYWAAEDMSQAVAVGAYTPQAVAFAPCSARDTFHLEVA